MLMELYLFQVRIWSVMPSTSHLKTLSCKICLSLIQICHVNLVGKPEIQKQEQRKQKCVKHKSKKKITLLSLCLHPLACILSSFSTFLAIPLLYIFSKHECKTQLSTLILHHSLHYWYLFIFLDNYT